MDYYQTDLASPEKTNSNVYACVCQDRSRGPPLNTLTHVDHLMSLDGDPTLGRSGDEQKSIFAHIAPPPEVRGPKSVPATRWCPARVVLQQPHDPEHPVTDGFYSKIACESI